MPWTGSDGFQFTRQSIQINAPARSGVYALFVSPNTWVYISESGDIQARLTQHLNGDNACISRFSGLSFAYELVQANGRITRQNALLSEIRTACNQMLG
jgi:excinuclease UvrABC nuclease subunit